MYHDVLVLVIALGAEPGKKGSAPFSKKSAMLSSNMLCFSSMSGSVESCPDCHQNVSLAANRTSLTSASIKKMSRPSCVHIKSSRRELCQVRCSKPVLLFRTVRADSFDNE